MISHGEHSKCTPGADKGRWCSRAGQNYPCAGLFPGILELCCSVSVPAIAAVVSLSLSPSAGTSHFQALTPYTGCASTGAVGKGLLKGSAQSSPLLPHTFQVTSINFLIPRKGGS